MEQKKMEDQRGKIYSKKYQALNFDDFRWCLDNDFQVYIVPLGSWRKEKVQEFIDDEMVLVEKDFFRVNGLYKIGSRRNGIKCEGKDYHYDKESGNTYTSKETLSNKTYRNEKDAINEMNFVRGYLRRKYG